MNKDRRKRIAELAEQLDGIKNDLETLGQEEQSYADDMPENMQSSERHDKAEEDASTLDDLANTLDDVIMTLSELAGA